MNFHSPVSLRTCLSLLSALILQSMHAAEPTNIDEAAQHFLQAAATMLRTNPAQIKVKSGPANLQVGELRAFRAVAHNKKGSVILQGFAAGTAGKPVVTARDSKAMEGFLKALNITLPSKDRTTEELVAIIAWLYPEHGEPYTDSSLTWKNETHRHRGRCRLTFTTKRMNHKGELTYWKVIAQVENDWTLTVIPSQLQR